MAFEAQYASSKAIALECLKDFEPEERLTVSAYAAAHRKIDNLSASPDGRWHNEKVPYTVQPSECLDSLDYLTVAVVGPGQVAKTVIAENWLLKSVGQDPANILWYMQTDDGRDAYVKGRIDPIINLHDEILKKRIGKRSKDDSLVFKNFGSMTVEFLSASPTTLINKTSPRIVADEIDNWQILGDPKGLLDIRRQAYGRNSKLLCISHPDRATGLDPAKHWNGGIMAIYGDSDRRAWYWPCPRCGAWSSPCPIAKRHMPILYPEGDDVPLDVIAAEAYLLCPSCNGKIVSDEREAMNLAAYKSHFGGWIGVGQEIDEGGTVYGERIQHDTAGFWIVGAMSPFVLGGIGGLAKARVKAEREEAAGGEDDAIKQVMVKQWGEPYVAKKNRAPIEVKVLQDRAEPGLQRGHVPDWVRFLTVAVDCQKAHFEFMVRGWGPGKESVVIEYGRILAQPDTNPNDWDAMRAQLLDKGWPLADGTGRRMRVRAFGFDLHGAEGVTPQAYSAWTRWRASGHAKLYGAMPDGNEAWSILPLRGNSGVQKSRLVVAYPETTREANKAHARGGIPVGSFSPNKFKDDLLGQLKRALPGDTYIHLPAWLKVADDLHNWFEQLVSERADASGKWSKITSDARNEALDLMVMTHVLAWLHAPLQLRWDRPPSWAATHDKNTYVFHPDTNTPAASATPNYQRLA